MDFKKFWKESLGGYVVKRVLLALVIFVALAWATLFSIDFYTHHGESETVPDLKGLYVEEAQQLLANHHLYAVVVDSVFDKSQKPGTIVEQTPESNASVKKNRAIYVVINSRQVRRIPVPDVNDMSYRQADAIIKAAGFNVSSVQYVPSEYKDLVVGLKYQGRDIAAGTRLPEGSFVVLVVGGGNTGGATAVPDLKGMKLEDARQTLMNDSIILGSVNYDVEPKGNESEYFIYRQQPAAGKTISAGSRIDVWLSRDKSMLNKTFDDNDNSDDNNEEEFF